ncbi:MFS transporter [Streptomyces incanus]|uniref:MFS transporter n=1 Tax=Streptomyces incanus TaxID=887453 RepID=A0ABW0XHM9_9ACTN
MSVSPTATAHDRERSGKGPRTRSFLGTLIAGCLAVFVAQLATTIPATLNGLFQADLQPLGSQLTWITAAFLLPIVVLELTFGVLGDLFGRRRLLVGGALLMVAGEVVAASAPDVILLCVGQALSGIGAAAVIPTSLTAIAVSTDDGPRRARVIAIWVTSLAVGNTLAPLLGGITANFGSWRWSFVVLAALAALSALVSALFAEESSAPEGRKLDVRGQITIAVALIALLYAVVQGPADGWGSPLIVVAFVVAAVFLALFVRIENTAKAPLLPLDIFRNRSFTIAAVVAVVGMFAFLGAGYATSMRMGPLQHQSPMRIAVAFLVSNCWVAVLTPVTGRMLTRLAPRWLLGFGLALISAGGFWAATLPITDTSLLSITLPLGLIGIGFGFTVSSITATAVNTVPAHLAGMASATTSLLRDLGFALGPAVVGAIALSRADSLFSTGLAQATDLSPAAQAAAGQLAEAAGPLAVNSAPAGSPPAEAAGLALESLSNGFSTGYLVCGIAALLCCVLVVGALRDKAGDDGAASTPDSGEASTPDSGAAEAPAEGTAV